MQTCHLEPYVKKMSIHLNPYQVLRIFDGDYAPVLLESGTHSDGLGRYSIVCSEPTQTFECKDNHYTLKESNTEYADTGDGLAFLKQLFERKKTSFRGDLPFYGGAVGFFSYDLKDSLENLPVTVKKDLEMPDIWLGFYDWALIHDCLKNTWWMVVSEWVEDQHKIAIELEQRLIQKQKDVLDIKISKRVSKPDFIPNMTQPEYIESIQKVREYIQSGDIYQVNFTQRFKCKLEGTPLDLYGKVRAINPAPFAAYLDTGEHQVVCSSPERFILLKDGLVETRPIKGTRPRGKTEEEDLFNKNELIHSEKDNAELLMIVDLERNDLGRIAQTGTVKVTELFKLETYATVFHLVATVQATLKERLDITDVIRATFPGGSITGAPKIRAMEIIDELEPTQRSLYTGSIGYIGYNGDADLNIVIRTIICKDEDAWFHVGGGIVWDSDPQLEYEESLHKARAQMRGLSV